MITPLLSAITGSIHVGAAALGSALGIGLIGKSAPEAVGRNPGAFPKVMVMAILTIAFAESITFFALFLLKN